MRLSGLSLALPLLLMMVACKSLPFFSGAEAASAQESTPDGGAAFSRATLEAQDISYDGEALSARFLVSPVGGSLRIDTRFIDTIALSVDSVVDCATGKDLSYIIMDVYAPRLREEDILILEPGFWYGKQVRLPLFGERATGEPSPACFEAEIIYHALDVKNAARVRVRAEQPRAHSPDAGTPAP